MDRLRTDFLFAKPSFLSGVARILDLFGIFDAYNESRKPIEADASAMYADWRMIGQDIMDATQTFESELKEEKDKQLALSFR
jgi:hypothetical protein